MGRLKKGWHTMNEILKEVILFVLTSMITIVSGCVTRLLTIKINEISCKVKDSRKAEFLGWVNNVIVQCVDTTTQTYIDTLRKNGKFDENAHKEAFDRTMNNISTILSEQDMATLGGYVGDASTWITTSIESYIKSSKKGGVTNGTE